MVICETIAVCAYDIRSQPPSVAQEQQQQQSGEITAAFAAEGYTLGITASCKTAARKCPFRAEISAPPTLFQLIQQVEYTYVPDRTKSSAPVTDASMHFRFEAEQPAGGKVHAAVTLRSRDGSSPKVVRIEGTVPFAVDVTPPLPAGLRFEINYRPWYLDGVPHEPVEYVFNIQLRGERAALKRVRSVEYRLPAEESKRPRIIHRVESGYYLEGSMPVKDGVSIIAVIRWKNRKSSTYTIPLRPPRL